MGRRALAAARRQDRRDRGTDERGQALHDAPAATRRLPDPRALPRRDRACHRDQRHLQHGHRREARRQCDAGAGAGQRGDHAARYATLRLDEGRDRRPGTRRGAVDGHLRQSGRGSSARGRARRSRRESGRSAAPPSWRRALRSPRPAPRARRSGASPVREPRGRQKPPTARLPSRPCDHPACAVPFSADVSVFGTCSPAARAMPR